ncbi:MAG: hypothetical protein PHR06_14055 [Candidatus Cloacimonetes bacterium]|nr:hypothetical protein [Candidatus Cloacimonadota bacterium]
MKKDAVIWFIFIIFLLSCSPKPVEQKESTPGRISFPKEGNITIPFTENQGQLVEKVLFYAQIAQGIVYVNNSGGFRWN